MSEKEWKVGDRAQWIDYESEETEKPIYGGEIVALTKATKQYNGAYRQYTEEHTSHVTVKWDDGEEETLIHYAVSPEDSSLEREFRKTAPLIIKQINEKLSLASKYLDEAEKIAEDNGIPFYSGISPLSQSYLTTTFPVKWEGVSKAVMQGVTETHNEYDDYYGWQHSSVC